MEKGNNNHLNRLTKLQKMVKYGKSDKAVKERKFMKNHIKALIMTAAVLTVATAMTVSCMAYDNTSNTQAMNELQSRADAYYEKVGGVTTEAETDTYNAVKVYIDRIDALRQATDRDTSAQMALEGKRGAAAGILSWIYFSHREEIDGLTDEDESVIGDEYRRQSEVIDKAEWDFFEGNGVTACYTRLLVEIYSRKIEALRVFDNGNQLVDKIIDLSQGQVMSRCAYSESFGEDAENCKIYYAEVSAKVRLQTLRDRTIEELRAVAESVYPDEEFDMRTEGRYAPFFSALNDGALQEAYVDGDVGDGEVSVVFNNALLSAVTEILALPDPVGEYKKAYHTGLCATVSDRVDIANAKAPAEQVAIADLFLNYSLGLLQAEAKDELSAYGDSIGRDAVLNIVILEYTGDVNSRGILDNTADSDAVEEELLSAKKRCVWYDTYRMSLERIKGYLGEGSDKAREAKVLYYAVDGKIKAGERQGDGDIAEALATDIAEMRAVVDRAEAEKFTVDHKAIIEKVDVRVSDKSALISAMTAADELGEGAQKFLSDILISLGEKYKKVTVEEMTSYVTEDGAKELRQSATYRLSVLVNALSSNNGAGDLTLKAMMAEADHYLEKAKNVKAVLDSYCFDYLEGGNEFFGKDTEKLVSDGIGEIISATDNGEGQRAEACILKIKRAAALEDIFAVAKGYEEIGQIPSILASAKTEIVSCLTDGDIKAYGTEKVAHISEIVRVFELNRASESIKDRVGEIKAKIDAYVYVDGNKRAELLTALEGINTESSELLSAAADGQGVKNTLSGLLIRLSEFEVGAENCELLGCLSYARGEIDNALGKREYYTEENFVRAQNLAVAFGSELSEAGSIKEYLEILGRALSEIGAVENLLDTAKREGREKLDALYEKLMKKKNCYSAKGLAELEEIYTHSITELSALQVLPTEAQKARELADERMKLMRAVRLQVIYTSDGILATQNEPIYPEDHLVSEKGYIGSVWTEGGIPSDARLTINPVSAENISDIIKKAAKNKSILVSGSVASSNIVKALKRGSAIMGMKIDVGNMTLDGGKYRVSVLLPAGIDPSEILGVILVREDGSVEFFEALSEGALLEFESDRFSNYYVIGKGSVDLLPLIICLSVIVFCELCVLALLIIRRRRAKDPLYGIIPAPFMLAAAYRPAGGNIIAAVLGVAAVGLLGAISYLAYLELRAVKRRKNNSESELPEKKKTAIVSVTADREVAPRETVEEKSEKLREIMDSVSVEAAESLMSDTEAKSLQRQSNEGYEDTEIYHGEKKTEINIDIISQNFADGETVTLNSLKEKKLVPQSAGRVKILARGVLDKRLRVVAQDFSDAAIKMILLTGGEAIVTYSASEQSEKRKK